MSEPRAPVYLTLPREIPARPLDNLAFSAEPAAVGSDPHPSPAAIDELAREAIAYATDPKELGGLSFTVIANATPIAVEEVDALAAKWQRAGMTVSIVSRLNPKTTEDLVANTWQIMDTGWAGCDLDPGNCAPINFPSGGTWSGIKDPALDALTTKAAAASSSTSRRTYYDENNQYLNAHYYFTWLWAEPNLMIARDNLEGLPISVGLDAPFNWGSVWLEKWHVRLDGTPRKRRRQRLGSEKSGCVLPARFGGPVRRWALRRAERRSGACRGDLLTSPAPPMGPSPLIALE